MCGVKEDHINYIETVIDGDFYNTKKRVTSVIIGGREITDHPWVGKDLDVLISEDSASTEGNNDN